MTTRKTASSSPFTAARIQRVFMIIGLVMVQASVSYAATIIIDGTAPDYILDGSFESGGVWQGSGSALATDLGITSGVLYRTTGGKTDGDRYVAVGENADGTTRYGVYVDTGYDLVANDVFSLSFGHLVHASLKSTDGMSVLLFTTTTGDDTGIVDTVIASVSVVGTLGSPSSFTGIGTVPASEVGERLFVAAVNGPAGTGDGGIFAFDAVNLASTIPEPASASLLVLGLAFALRRRR